MGTGRTLNGRVDAGHALRLAGLAQTIKLVVADGHGGTVRVAKPVEQEEARMAVGAVGGIGASGAGWVTTNAGFGQGVRVCASGAARVAGGVEQKV